MSRKCVTCQHTKRGEIDRRLAGGEPGKQVAQDYGLNPSSLHRHRVNCLKLASSNAIMKETARGTAAVACLPSRNDLSAHYFDLQARLDEIVKQAEQAGQPKTAISGLNSIRQTLDSLMRLAAHDRPTTQVQVAIQNNLGASLSDLAVAELAARLIEKFDHEPELKGRIAEAIHALADDAGNGEGAAATVLLESPDDAGESR
jgi:hypothetical protein